MSNFYSAVGPDWAPDTLRILHNVPPGQKHICATKKKAYNDTGNTRG